MVEIIRIIGIGEADNYDITPLLVNFRSELALLKKRRLYYSIADAKEELTDNFINSVRKIFNHLDFRKVIN